MGGAGAWVPAQRRDSWKACPFQVSARGLLPSFKILGEGAAGPTSALPAVAALSECAAVSSRPAPPSSVARTSACPSARAAESGGSDARSAPALPPPTLAFPRSGGSRGRAPRAPASPPPSGSTMLLRGVLLVAQGKAGPGRPRGALWRLAPARAGSRRGPGRAAADASPLPVGSPRARLGRPACGARARARPAGGREAGGGPRTETRFVPAALQLAGALDPPAGSCAFDEGTCGFDSESASLPWILNEEGKGAP